LRQSIKAYEQKFNLQFYYNNLFSKVKRFFEEKQDFGEKSRRMEVMTKANKDNGLGKLVSELS
jgi:hypothetical protein